MVNFRQASGVGRQANPCSGARLTAHGARNKIYFWVMYLSLSLSLSPCDLRQVIYGDFVLNDTGNFENLLGTLDRVYLAINVRSHMGRNIASAKKPTTAASPTVSSGPIASDNFFIEYSTSVS